MPTTRRSGRPIHYRTFGHGPPLLLLHGILGRGADWTRRGYSPALRDRATVVEIDALGHGRSAAPPDQAAYALGRRVADVVAVLDDLGAATADVWGYSMGGWLACGLARHAPERCASLVVGGWDPRGGIATAYAHFRALAPLPADVDWFDLMLRQAAAAAAADARAEANTKAGADADADHAPLRTDAEIDADARQPALLAGATAAPQHPALPAGADLAAIRRCLAALDGSTGLDADLRAANLPLLLYCGAADPYHDPMRALAETAGAPFATIPAADHLAAWRQSAPVLAAVRPFLAAKATAKATTTAAAPAAR